MKKIFLGMVLLFLAGSFLPVKDALALPGRPIVVLNPGHGTVIDSGKIDPGAVSGSLLEKDINLEVAQKTKALLSNCPLDVYLTRNGDDHVNQLTGIKKIVNDLNPSIGIAIHTNSAGSGSPSGTEAWSTVGGNNDSESKRLGGILASQISSVLGIKNYGVKLETSNRHGGLYIHGWNAPASLIELGYLQGDKDALTNRRDDFANAIAIGILQYFSISKDCLGSGATSSSQPSPSPQVDDPVGKMFAYGQCTYYAAKSRDDLFKVITQSTEIQAMGWAAARWDDNFSKLYVNEKSSYLVDDIPEINAVMVWDPGVGGADATNGHVGIVESVVDDKTVIVRDANWGGTPDVKTRTVNLLSGMHFIHTISYKQDAGQDGSANFVAREVSGSFSVINPLRNIYVKSTSEFVLTVDGKEVLSSARPQRQAIFSTTQWLSPAKDHSYLIKYQELQNIDPLPELIQTWWPNSLVQAGEPDPPLQVNYNYFLSPQSARIGDQVEITIGANIPSVIGLIEGINVYVDGRLLSSINGQNGMYVWDTHDFSVGLHQIEFEARINGFSGAVKKASTSFNLTANDNGHGSAPVNNDAGACTESSIRIFLESKGSPLQDYASDFIAAGELYNVDPRFIVSISNAESSLGTRLCASFNAWGIMSSGSCRAFSSWPEGISYVTRLVGYNYLPKGQNNIPSFVKISSTNGGICTQHCYCASGCDNWIKNVGSAYQQMGGDPETGDLTFKSCSSSEQSPLTNHPANAPTLVSPDDWAVTQNPSMQLCAKENGDPDTGDRVTEYFFQIFDSAQNWESNWTSAGCVTPVGLGVYNYQWRVKVRDTHGAESSWSDVRHFSVTGNSAGPMEKPILLSPSNNRQLPADKPVELVWNISGQAQKYKVEVWGGQYNLMTPCDWQSATTCAMGTMWPGTMYWHVKAKDASGKETEWSDTWSFSVSNNQNPISVERPALNYPQNNAVFTDADEIQLRWNGMNNAAAYTVELWGGQYDRMVPCNLTIETECNIGKMYAGVMSWRVKAKRAGNQFTDWSDTWTFEVQQKSNASARPEKPMLSNPANNAEITQETDITLVWNNSSNGYDYKVELWGEAYDQKMTPCEWGKAVNCHIGTMWPGLASWHVIARDQNGVESDWSNTWSFRVKEVNIPAAVEIPILVNPSQNFSLQKNEVVVLQWNSSANATEYQVELWGGPYSTMTPCNWVMDTSCYIGEMWPGVMQWHVRARNGQGMETGWSDTWAFTVYEIAVVSTEPPPPPPTEPPIMRPGFVELVDNLELRSDGSGSWPPLAGDKLIAHIKVRNGGDESIHVANIGIRGRRNGSDFWDIGFWSVDLDGNSEWSLDPNNERPLEPGSYSFRISYTLDGSNWVEIGNEINFTVQ